MSNYNWARGSVKIPAKFYPKVRDAVIKAHNERQEFLLKRALKVYEAIKAAKLKRGTNKPKLLEDDYYCEEVMGRRNIIEQLFSGVSYEERQDIQNSIFPLKKDEKGRIVWGSRGNRPVKPKKKDFPLASSRTKNLGDCDCSISFDNKERRISFGCEENNRSQERFLEHALYRALYRALLDVEWTSRTGGQLIGNDEYSRGSDYEGQGGNYVLCKWGKKVKPRRGRATSNYARLGWT